MKINEQQLERLIDTYQNLVYSVCFKITGNHFDAQDMAQETFLSAFKHFETFDGANEKAWICRIATNKCLDLKRKAMNRQVPTEDVFFEEMVSVGATMEEEFLDKQVREELKERCEKLKPPYGEIALKFFYEELSVGQIAERLKRNEKTVQTQVYRAKAMLRKSYGKE